MEDQIRLREWGTDLLVSKGHVIEHKPELVLSTPWSTVIRFLTTTGNFYLKQTPSTPFLANEPQIIRLLSGQFNARVPIILAINEDLHCFMMQDAGRSLRAILKKEFNPDLLCDAIKQYAAIQRSTETEVESFLKLDVKDWRLDKLPFLYDHILKQTDFLKAESFTEKELQKLHDLSPQFLAQCKLLSKYKIPETLGYHDFHDKNVLLDINSNRMTIVDWGETAIIHPFFPLFTCIQQAIVHHGVKEGDDVYNKLQDACLENWLGLITKNQSLEMFALIKQLWPIFSMLACYQCMMSVDLQVYKIYYADRPSMIAKHFREYIEVCK